MQHHVTSACFALGLNMADPLLDEDSHPAPWTFVALVLAISAKVSSRRSQQIFLFIPVSAVVNVEA